VTRAPLSTPRADLADLDATAELAEAIVFEDDCVLLIRRRDVPVWTLPGGHRDPGESATTSCVREVEEETGIHVRIAEPLGYYRRPWWLSGGRAAVYRCERTGGELRPGEFEGEAHYWPVHRLPTPILYWYVPIIQAAFAARGGAAARPYALDPHHGAPTLRGFVRSLLPTPRLWFPLLFHALNLQVSSRLAQWRAKR